AYCGVRFTFRLGAKVEDNEILYHYTSIEALNSILQNKSIWVSDCRFLNDVKELNNAKEMFVNSLPQYAQTALDLALHTLGFNYFHCILSLSKSPKILSQWRAYGNDGYGAALGIRCKDLNRVHSDLKKELVECVYHDHEGFIKSLLVMFKSEIDEIVELYNQNQAHNIFMQHFESSPDLLDRIVTQLLRVKNAAFEEEGEFRFVVHVPANNVKTRVSNNLIIPYFEHSLIDIGDEKFSWCVTPEIWFGPKADDRNIYAINAFQHFRLLMGHRIHKYDCGYV
ncbi:DUF2971 domain-containing protein, partial [Colwellia sp. E2M01]|uniref:DUF2971 domain-containing protein n=1 Tax=Colwellia sp. E2M01 TaxID=2841561 RepID=UPI001C097FCE